MAYVTCDRGAHLNGQTKVFYVNRYRESAAQLLRPLLPHNVCPKSMTLTDAIIQYYDKIIRIHHRERCVEVIHR